MADVKELMQGALQELAEADNSPKNNAIKELIRIEKNYYYSSRGSSGRLKEIREVISQFSSLEGAGNAD